MVRVSRGAWLGGATNPLGPGPWSLVMGLILTLAIQLLAAAPAQAQIHSHGDENGVQVVRSLDSLRDLDDQSWQLVAYREGPPGGPLRLRIVSFPGRVRLEHPHGPAGELRPQPLGPGRYHYGQPQAGP